MNTYARRPSSKDIARLAGVSQATVSRVMSGHPHVREETRERVLAVMRAANYQPNAMARAMKTQLSGTVGVVVSRITNPVVPEILQGLGVQLSRLGRHVIVWNTDSDGEDGVVSAIRQSVVEGLVFTAARAGSAALTAALEHRVSTVLLNRTVVDAACDQVSADNHGGAERLARYLVGAGRRRVALVNGPLDRSTLREREAGLRAGLAATGLGIAREHYVSAPFVHEVFRDSAMRMMALPEPPDVICCGNDVIAMGVLCGLRASGRRVPEDVWVTGFDGIEMAGWDLFDLTTVRQPMDRMVALAVERLVARQAAPERAPELTRFETELVVRGTTAHTPATH